MAQGLIRKTLIAAAVAATGLHQAAQADTITAYCILSHHDHTIPLEKGPCQFSQRQGNVNVQLNSWAFRFNPEDSGHTYQRQATDEGLRFNREGHYTLMVYWEKPKL